MGINDTCGVVKIVIPSETKNLKSLQSFAIPDGILRFNQNAYFPTGSFASLEDDTSGGAERKILCRSSLTVLTNAVKNLSFAVVSSTATKQKSRDKRITRLGAKIKKFTRYHPFLAAVCKLYLSKTSTPQTPSSHLS